MTINSSDAVCRFSSKLATYLAHTMLEGIETAVLVGPALILLDINLPDQSALLGLSTLLEKDPRSTAILRDLAACYQQMGQQEKFREINGRAIFIDMTKYGRFPGTIETNLSLHKTFRRPATGNGQSFICRRPCRQARPMSNLSRTVPRPPTGWANPIWPPVTTGTALRELAKAVQLKP